MEDDSDREAEKHGEEGQPLMSHKSERKSQEVLVSSGDTEYSYKPAPQNSPDDSNVCSSFDVRTGEKVMHFIRDFNQRTGAVMDPQEAVILLAKAGGDDQLALRRYFAGLRTPSIVLEDLSTPPEPRRWPPPGAVQGTDKQRSTDKGLKGSSKESEKKRCGLTKVLRRRKGVSRD